MTLLIAYDTDHLDANLTIEKAQHWHKKGLISVDKLKEISAHHPTTLYSPNIFMRVGSFIFCTLLISSLFGLFALLGGSTNGFYTLALFCGIACFFALEFVIKSKHYRSGIDDALLYSSLNFIIWASAELLKLEIGTLTFYWLILSLCLFAAIRYTDRIMTAVSYGILVTISVLTTMKFPTIAPSVLSFVVTIFAAITYFVATKAQKNVAFRFWKNNLDVVETLSLALFYGSCNYYVLQQANETYFGNPTVSLAPLFWFLTFFIPLLYIYQGLKQKNRLLLSMGLLAVAAGVFTFRYYFHVVPMEVAAILGGAVLLAIAYFSIQYLKRHKTPFTYEEDGEKPFYQQAESLVIAQSLGGTTEQEGAKPQFGGGDFGGGGAGSNF